MKSGRTSRRDLQVIVGGGWFQLPAHGRPFAPHMFVSSRCSSYSCSPFFQNQLSSIEYYICCPTVKMF